MAQVLTPGFKLLRCAATLFAQHGKRVAQAVRVGIGQASRLESGSKNAPDGGCILPMIARKPNGTEQAGVGKRYLGCRKQGIIRAEP